MARTFHRRESLGAMSEINVTPLIDLAFALLIIFMITAPLLEQSIALELPQESQSIQETTEKYRFQTISITVDGQIYWGDMAVDEEKLAEYLESMATASDLPVINIRADRSIPYQRVINVIDLVKQSGLSRISLDTRIE